LGERGGRRIIISRTAKAKLGNPCSRNKTKGLGEGVDMAQVRPLGSILSTTKINKIKKKKKSTRRSGSQLYS
jgi:hypothetical protein